MGRTATATTPSATARKSDQALGTTRTSAAKVPAKPSKPAAAAGRVTTPAAPKPSKEALRAQVEKLERDNATLRAKRREASRTAKASAARIAELEAQVGELEKRLASSTAAGKQALRPAKPARAARRPPDIDPGDAVPPGVAVQEPAPLDEEAETALENLEQHLGDT